MKTSISYQSSKKKMQTWIRMEMKEERGSPLWKLIRSPESALLMRFLNGSKKNLDAEMCQMIIIFWNLLNDFHLLKFSIYMKFICWNSHGFGKEKAHNWYVSTEILHSEVVLHCFSPLFVTWKKVVNGGEPRLRGCIGSLEARGLINGFRDYALNRFVDVFCN